MKLLSCLPARGRVAGRALATAAVALATAGGAVAVYVPAAHAQGGYSYTTLDNSNDLTFNQLLGINSHGKVFARYYGSGWGKATRTRATLLLPPYHQSSYRVENFPHSGADSGHRPERHSASTVGFFSHTNTGTDANYGWYSPDNGRSFHSGGHCPATGLQPGQPRRWTQLLGDQRCRSRRRLRRTTRTATPTVLCTTPGTTRRTFTNIAGATRLTDAAVNDERPRSRASSPRRTDRWSRSCTSHQAPGRPSPIPGATATQALGD